VRVLLFGATGMVGAGVLIECLEDPSVGEIVSVGRRPTGVSHPKLREGVRSDFLDWSDAGDLLAGFDACLFCLGVSSVGMEEAEYRRLTYDLTLAAASRFATESPGATFCYVSGEGTDATENGRVMWARVKGETENALLDLPLETYLFRPGYIDPRKGVRSPHRSYRIMHLFMRPLFPLARRIAGSHVTTSDALGRAMIRVAEAGYTSRVLENRDINALGATARPSDAGGGP
jgi:uncharacterized protein YbjT (DUF2867 family)